eukprot:724227-Prymnesium_polylepis.1
MRRTPTSQKVQWWCCSPASWPRRAYIITKLSRHSAIPYVCAISLAQRAHTYSPHANAHPFYTMTGLTHTAPVLTTTDSICYARRLACALVGARNGDASTQRRRLSALQSGWIVVAACPEEPCATRALTAAGMVPASLAPT